MSAGYSNSPALRLRIAESRIQRWFVHAYWLALLIALGEAARRGHPWVLAALAPLVLLLRAQRRQPLAGAVITWRAGRWRIADADGSREFDLLRCHCLPWVTFLAWRESGGRCRRLWLFADSAAREPLRRLRVRLALEGAV